MNGDGRLSQDTFRQATKGRDVSSATPARSFSIKLFISRQTFPSHKIASIAMPGEIFDALASGEL
jgi:hypothetical protein